MIDYEFEVISPQTRDGVETELNKRAAAGWEFVAVYAAALGQKAHLIFRRKEQTMKFDEFMHLPPTEERGMLVQAIAIISAQPRYENMTPEEVYDYVAARAAEIKAMG